MTYKQPKCSVCGNVTWLDLFGDEYFCFACVMLTYWDKPRRSNDILFVDSLTFDEGEG